MSCQEVVEFIDAYVDKELDVVTNSQFERHLAECSACRARYDAYRQMHGSVKAHMESFQVPDGFEQKLREQLFPHAQRDEKAVRHYWFASGQLWAIAASVVAVLVFAAMLFQSLRRPSQTDMLAQQVVSSHIRSLLANHLSDVVSTDQHTVKPWFSGKLDFAPVVKDLGSKGFPMAGGRLDYLDDRPVAALVYKRRQHTINLFLWPSAASDSSARTLTIRGYNVVHWTRSHMAFWAVSDVNAGDMSEFVRDIED